MDGGRFDDLARGLSSRRTALGGLLAGVLLPLEAAARKKGKEQKRKGKGKQRANAQAEPCWRAGACIVSKGSNVSQCDLAGYTAPESLDCTRCNLSRANLSGADLTGVNFTRANLSGACLIDADFTGATFAATTNLSNAIFCNTTMPNGSVNNSGCGAGTACCGTCVKKTCQDLGKTCGTWPDGCGGTVPCGSCSGQQICANGTCQACDVCASGCAFPSIGAAISSTTPQLSTIHVCPGTYDGFSIGRALTVIGAGDGDNPATSTIVRVAQTNTVVVAIANAGGPVRLDGLRVTGASGFGAFGARINNSSVTLANCAITGNTTGTVTTAAGINANNNAQLELVNTRIFDNSGAVYGGIAVNVASVTFDTLSRVTDNRGPGGTGGLVAVNGTVTLPSVDNVSDNTPTNCRNLGGSTFNGPGNVCLTT